MIRGGGGGGGGGELKINDSGGRARIVPVFIPPRAALENVDDPVAVRWKLLPQKENAHRFVLVPVSSQGNCYFNFSRIIIIIIITIIIIIITIIIIVIVIVIAFFLCPMEFFFLSFFLSSFLFAREVQKRVNKEIWKNFIFTTT